MKNLIFTVLVFIVLLSCRDNKLSDRYPPLNYDVYFSDTKIGFLHSSIEKDSSYKFVFDFNERGRGPHLEEIINLSQSGIIEKLRITGHNYYKDTVNEVFTINKNIVSWKSGSEEGSEKFKGQQFFIGVNSTYGNTELLIKKLLSVPNKSADLLPGGTAKITGVSDVPANDTTNLKLIELTGLNFSPDYYWVDNNLRFFAFLSTWSRCIRAGYDGLSPRLLEIQTEKQKEYFSKLAEQLREAPSGDLIIRNVNLFNANKGGISENKTVIIRGDKIQKILSGDAAIPEASVVIDGTNKTLLPGLFDNHTHTMDRYEGILSIAAGVTSVRDMGNSLDFPRLKEEFDSNKSIGPRVLIIYGIIDKTGPYTALIGKNVNSLEEGLAAIDYYHDRKYDRIKFYSSLEPGWIKPLATKAHSLNMKTGGHIPAHMLAREAVMDGYDEISHINMIVLNFLSDTIDTRTPLRFSMVGKYACDLDLKSNEFKSFLRLLKERKVVIDPTVSIFEGLLTCKPGNPDPVVEPVLDRLPIQIRRSYSIGGFPIPEGMESKYNASFNEMLEIIHEFYANGITILPGTDDMQGFTLHKELENYVKAGIPVAEVLRMATILSAQEAGAGDRLGSVEEGKLADLILVDGNPLRNISDIRRVEMTIKDGSIYNTEKLYAAIGVKYFK